MSNIKIGLQYYLYVTGILDNPILKSQVFNWIEVLQNKGIVFDILTCPSLHYLLRNLARHRSFVKNARNILKGKVFQLPVLRSVDRFDLLSPSIKAAYILALLFVQGRKRDVDRFVLQSRSGINFKTFKFVKKLNKKVKVIFEFRGSAPEEYLNSLSFESIDQVSEQRTRKIYEKLVRRDIELLNFSDMVFCVSDSLRQYLLNLSSSSETMKKIHVVPGAADEKVFFYNQRIRQRKRMELHVEHKLVLIYTGRFKNAYHKKELIFAVASRFIAESRNHFFICLTPDVEMAHELKKINGMPDTRILIKYIDTHTEINEYLNAADIGIILRDNVPTNNVSSPTKIAEYLLTGLPIIASDHIGDYSSFIRKEKLGVIVDNEIEQITSLLKLNEFKSVERSMNSKISKTKFSKQANSKIILKALNEL